jgi:hypothetical protein
MDSQAKPTQSGRLSEPAQTPQSVTRYSIYAVGVLTGLNFLNYIDRQILPAVG